VAFGTGCGCGAILEHGGDDEVGVVTAGLSTKAAAANWALACQQTSQAVAECFTACREDPRPRTARHHPLRGDLATRVLQGHDGALATRDHAGGRVWLLIDEDKHTVWIDEVHLGHPAKTDT